MFNPVGGAIFSSTYCSVGKAPLTNNSVLTLSEGVFGPANASGLDPTTI